MLCLTSAAWEVDVFYCLGSIIDTCRAMFRGFLDGHQSTRRADAWRTFCRYIRYVCDSLTVRQGTKEAELTITEQGHVPVLHNMQGLTAIFSMLSMTMLLQAIDYRQYINPSPLSQREEQEIAFAQSEAEKLIGFLTDKIALVEDKTGRHVLVKEAFVSYLTFQGRWLLWHFKATSDIQQDMVCGKVLTINLLQNDNAREVLLAEESWKEWGGKAPDCFGPVDSLLHIGFSKDPIKRKLGEHPTDQPSKRQRM